MGTDDDGRGEKDGGDGDGGGRAGGGTRAAQQEPDTPDTPDAPEPGLGVDPAAGSAVDPGVRPAADRAAGSVPGQAVVPVADPVAGPDPVADPDPASDRRARRRRRTRRVLYAALGLFCAGLLLIAGTVYWAYEHYTGRVQRIPNVFPTGVPAAALPPPSKDGSENFLLVGVDSRSDLPTTGKGAKAPEWRPGAQRSDTMMLVHLPADHKHVYVVSLPRDAWVSIPGHGRAKLNAAFSWGGPPLLIDTVQRLTRVAVDHLAVIDWSGFRALTDAVGGVDITVDKTVRRTRDTSRTGAAGSPQGWWTAGTHHMDGAEALDYVRERYNLPRGDLDRTHRQQNFLRAVLSKVMSGSTFSNPLRLKRTLDEVTSVVSVDDRLSDSELRGLVWKLHGVRSSDMVFMNAPVAGFDMIDKQSVVLLDANGTAALWEAFRNDTMADYVASHSVDALGDHVS